MPTCKTAPLFCLRHSILRLNSRRSMFCALNVSSNLMPPLFIDWLLCGCGFMCVWPERRPRNRNSFDLNSEYVPAMCALEYFPPFLAMGIAEAKAKNTISPKVLLVAFSHSSPRSWMANQKSAFTETTIFYDWNFSLFFAYSDRFG